ncbi:hypothetical protein JIQ42_01219 [Leishmania sp. Namibia]|uniref:hypothetical protein n=1 Tax=Leishmania sp. Namibia TaxID=2802991 RepID=UPI001B55B279|nr:hypothetical protein JIQ42_01219 [Leishmania sp. Namibia]
MFDSLRLLVLSFLYYFGFTYAAFTALQQRVTTVTMVESSGLSAPTESAPPPWAKVLIGVPALKLMIMLTSMAMLSLLGADWLPLFAEMRVIFMYTLLFAPPFTQQELYDQLFAPLLVRGGTFALSLQKSDFLSRKVSLFVVRLCVDIAIAAMNYAQRSRSLDDNATLDILSGLRFSQRALQQVAEMARESEGATYTHMARDSNFAVGIFASHVRRALMVGSDGEELHDRIPHRRTMRGDDTDRKRGSHVTAASLPEMSSLPRPRADGLMDDVHGEYAYTASQSGEVGRPNRLRLDGRHH